MDFEKLDLLAQKLMLRRREHRERERGFIYYHGKRVGNGAIELRKLLFPEDTSMDDALLLAGMFHDVGKGMTPHAKYGAAIFREAVQDIVEPDMIDRCAAMIAHHPDRVHDGNSPFDTATQLLQDSDLLDHQGCYSLWMCAQYYGYYDGGMEAGVAAHNEEFYKTYCEDNLPTLNFSLSKQIFLEKLAAEQAFFKRASIESKGSYILPQITE